jgi:uncharacterized protein YbjQ (UPF0145 family)
MILTTSDTIPGQVLQETCGLVKGNAVRARHMGKDITAMFKNMVGGELDEYTKLLAESREQALDRMVADAKSKGADAIVTMRFSSSQISAGAAEVLVYGTAVKLAPAS